MNPAVLFLLLLSGAWVVFLAGVYTERRIQDALAAKHDDATN